MIRVVLFLVSVCLIALGAAWLADRPGDVAITWPWLGWRIETSLMMAAVAVAALAAIASLVLLLMRALVGSPARVAAGLRERRRRRGQSAISRGLVAIGSGDARAALRFAGEAARIAPSEPLALLLAAQTAQLSGDRAAAEAAFRTMTAHGETQLLGLRGLYVEALRREDAATARQYAEDAARLAPALPWAGQAVLDFRCADADWDGALDIVERHRQTGVIDKPTYRRRRAVLLTARALAAEERERDRAITIAVEATKLAPDLVPAAALAGRLLADGGEPRKAGKIVEAAWRANPHPDLAEIYAHLRLADTARERLARIEALARQPAGHTEGALAVARAALDAREFERARRALAPLLDEPTQRVAMLMAELEELEHGDEGRAREWMARAVRAGRDPAWTADGFVSDRWMPVSPVTGRLDAFQWKVPLAELADDTPLIEDRAPALETAAHTIARDEETPGATTPSSTPAPRLGIRPPVRPAGPLAEPVIPLLHVPDDPGPDQEFDAEPETEPQPGWRRFTSMFR